MTKYIGGLHNEKTLIEVGTKPLSQTKEGLEFEFFLKFQSFYFA